MKTYLVKLKPLDPYFFGNEKGFAYKDASDGNQYSNSYFIRSEYTPSQSTILGAMRCAFLAVKKDNWDYTDDDKILNAAAVGPDTFSPAKTNQSFGKIKKLSPVFLLQNDEILVPAPFDHNGKSDKYTPFSEYKEAKVGNDVKYYTDEYDPKEGIVCGYLNIETGNIIKSSNIFDRVVRTGINRSAENKGFFKKEYGILKDGFSFGIYITLEDDLVPKNDVMYLGQGKSSFAVSFVPQENQIAEKVKSYLSDNVVYCFGDSFISSDIYDDCLFSVANTTTYRLFQKYGRKISRDPVLYRPVTAGSVFIPKNKEEFLKKAANNNFNQIGYNEFITN